MFFFFLKNIYRYSRPLQSFMFILSELVYLLSERLPFVSNDLRDLKSAISIKELATACQKI